jgi:hypothetical protein
MAAWVKPFLLALLATLALHLLGLTGIATQMKTASSILQNEKDPLFTRTISAASEPSALATPPSTPLPPAPATAGLRNLPSLVSPEPSKSEVTATQAEPTSTVTPIEPSVAQVAATPTQVDINTTQAPSTPTQNISEAPTGRTDSLLVTGQWPGDTRLSYRLTGYFQGELFGKGEVQWTRSGPSNERYQVRVIVDAGLLEMRMTSQGRVSPQGLLPQAFEEYRKLALQQPRVRPLTLEDDVLILEGGRRMPRPVTEPMAVQDTVSQFVDLGHRFTQGKAKLEAGQVVRIWLGRPGGLDEWVYDIGEAETMELPRIGKVTVHALKPRPLANPRGTITMSMWLAPSLQYLPAKIRIQVNAESYAELIAERLEQR